MNGKELGSSQPESDRTADTPIPAECHSVLREPQQALRGKFYRLHIDENYPAEPVVLADLQSKSVASDTPTGKEGPDSEQKPPYSGRIVKRYGH